MYRVSNTNKASYPLWLVHMRVWVFYRLACTVLGCHICNLVTDSSCNNLCFRVCPRSTECVLVYMALILQLHSALSPQASFDKTRLCIYPLADWSQSSSYELSSQNASHDSAAAPRNLTAPRNTANSSSVIARILSPFVSIGFVYFLQTHSRIAPRCSQSVAQRLHC